MTSFIAIYRGQTVGDAKLIAVSADTALVADVSKQILARGFTKDDRIISELENGRRAALRLIEQEAKNATYK